MRSPLLRYLILSTSVALAATAQSPAAGLTRIRTTSPVTTAGKTCTLKYNDGPVISKVQAVIVFWGEVSKTVQKNAVALVGTVVASPYLDALSEYSTDGQRIERGTVLAQVRISPHASKSSLTATDVSNELVAQIQAKKLPAPTYDSTGNTNTLYLLFFAPGLTVTSSSGSVTCQESDKGACGFHSQGHWNGKILPYAVMPDYSTGCYRICGGDEKTAFTQTTAHEIAEAVTDPGNTGKGFDGIAWYSDDCSGEISDLCAPSTGTGKNAGAGKLNGWNLPFNWSNAHSTCELSNASIGPQGGCTTNANCTEPLPICDAKARSCVGCQKNADCKGPTPFCDPDTKACRPCEANRECGGDTPACILDDGNPKAGSCAQCIRNDQCKPEAPVCADFACTGCASDADCTDEALPHCDSGSGACVAEENDAGDDENPLGDAGAGGKTGGHPKAKGGAGSTTEGCGASRAAPAGGRLGVAAVAFFAVCALRRRSRKDAARVRS